LAILLRYNSRIDPGRSRISLIGPGETSLILHAAAESPPGVIDTAADLEPGAYVLKWQVLATDGHITRGRVPFTVDAAH
jgi:methionine-rich copper-binding protein CopC